MTGIQFRSKTLDIGSFITIRNIRDHTKRKVYAQYEPRRQALRALTQNTTLPQRTRALAALQLSQMHAYTRSTQIRNRCIMAGKAHGVMRDFGMSRFQFRLCAMEGRLPGVRKAQW